MKTDTTPTPSNRDRRRVLQSIGATAIGVGCVGSGLLAMPSQARAATKTIALGDKTRLHILSDGYLDLPAGRLFQSEAQQQEASPLFAQAGLSTSRFNPPLNVTLLETETRKILFDIGSGSNFLATAGQLPGALEAAGIDPLDITDVVFTHAHPDHCWGLLDDFDDLLCSDATYHMHGSEYDYWLSEDTLTNTDEAGLGMVAGARNRLPLIEEQLQRFNWGDEVLPGIEAIDTHGHTPGHTSFIIHSATMPVTVIGDALIHPLLSFAKPDWPWQSDLDVDAAINSRKKLLDHLTTDRLQLIGYHLPEPGIGLVEKNAEGYRYIAS